MHGLIVIVNTSFATIEYLEEIQAVLRQRWQQVISDVHADSHMVDLDIPQPVSAYI